MKNPFVQTICRIMILALLFQTFAATTAFAEEEKDMWVKLGRGSTNIATGWVEVFNQPLQMAKTERWAIAMGGGVPKGIFMALMRTLVGAYETLTFVIPNGERGYAGFLEPEMIIPR